MRHLRDERPVTPPLESDAYAATYMKGAGRVLLRDKTVGRKLLVVLGLVTLWCAGGAVATFLGALPKSSVGVGLLLTLMTALFASLAMTLTVVRAVVRCSTPSTVTTPSSKRKKMA